MADHVNARKAAYKHVSIADSSLSQQARRTKALEEQKKRRARKVDASRQLDSFANLNLGSSDEEDGKSSQIVRQGLGAFVNTLEAPSASSAVIAETAPTFSPSRKPKKRRGTRIKKHDPAHPSEWADKCMYAELLEMHADDPWSGSDGLPDDLETGWVAIAPVPAGKRCLAISHQGAGLAPNTTLRSRALGKPLMPRFPSTIPPNTIVDCILDANWRDNGILHILDVIKWKGQDIGDCETAFRFWWRDTRLAELSQSPPPSASYTNGTDATTTAYRFSYPTTFIPVPHHTDTSLSNLITVIVPLARTPYVVSVQVPTEGDMDSGVGVICVDATVGADGLLLYVAEASYESGSSPLSSWVPIASYDGAMDDEAPLDKFSRLVSRRLGKKAEVPPVDFDEPMDI